MILKNDDIKYMKRAIILAKRGVGKVNLNPLVGAVIVKDGKIIGEGYHKKYGSHHAEVNAFLDAEKKHNDVTGATIYVTLEPCSHYGKTPPCSLKIVEKKIRRVVIGSNDPNPLVAGKGIEILKKNGIEVETEILKDECDEINRVFMKYILTKIPYIFIKVGITIDGKIATYNGNSKWITNEIAREKVQQYRNEFSGILIGGNTLYSDNPSLLTQLKNKRNPYRIIIDRDLLINENYNVVKNNIDKKTIVITDVENIKNIKIEKLETNFNVKFIFLKCDKNKKFNMKKVITKIGELGIDSILVEGGNGIISSFFKENLVDAGEIFISNKILGDSNGIPFISGFSTNELSECIELNNVKINAYGNNVGIEFESVK